MVRNELMFFKTLLLRHSSIKHVKIKKGLNEVFMKIVYAFEPLEISMHILYKSQQSRCAPVL